MSCNLLFPLRRPTVIENIHESCFRVSETLDAVVWLLEEKAPHEVILNYIQSIQDADPLTQETRG